MHRLRGLARAVERHELLARLAVLHELEAPEAAEAAHLADARVLLGQLRQLDAEDLAHRGRVLDDALLLEGLDRRDGRSARERMARVGEPAGEELRADELLDRGADGHRAERHVARVDALGHRDDVRDDVPVVDREPLAGAAEAGHHLVGDQQDPVPVADLADRLQVAVGRDDDPVRADDGLEDHGGDGVRALVHEDLLEVRRARAHRARVGVAGRAAVGERVEHAHDAGDAGLGGPAARVAGQRDRAAVAPW